MDMEDGSEKIAYEFYRGESRVHNHFSNPFYAGVEVRGKS
jgi:hypothetical protein